MNVELKSTGFILDELTTVRIRLTKAGFTEDAARRRDSLATAYTNRIHKLSESKRQQLLDLEDALFVILDRCWDAQDRIMNFNRIISPDIDQTWDCAVSAVEAQTLNAKRNKLIRQIDQLLDEAEFTQLEKNYG